MEGERSTYRVEDGREIYIDRLLNFPVDSNCYIISRPEGRECMLVDPARERGSSLEEYLSARKLSPEYIILTHEHFDHISSVEHLRKKYGCKVIASAACSDRIVDPKKNLSLFYDQQGFSCMAADMIIAHGCSVQWRDIQVDFYVTPGHSQGGICFRMGNNLFTGDTLMREYKPVVKLPGGNKKELEASISLLLGSFGKDTTVFPGHGEIFILGEWTNNLHQ
jgi:hydroxyacylglutathione hydrolase